MDVDSTIEEIAKDAANEASNIAAGEAIRMTDEDFAKAAHKEDTMSAAEECVNKNFEATKDIPIS
jgi:hypothetical protein